MLRRYALAFIRNLAQFGLDLVGLAMAWLLVVAATLVVPYLPAARAFKRLADLGRRLAERWGEIPVPVDHRPGPAAPERRADGWYVHLNQLYRSPRVPAYLAELEWQAADPELGREWRWLAITPVTGGLAVLLPPTLVAAGAGLAVLALTGGTAPLIGAPALAMAIPAGLALLVLGVALGPATLRLHARWTRMMLQPATPTWWQRSRLARWAKRLSSATWHGGGLAGLGFAAFGGFLLNLLVAVLSYSTLFPQVSALTRPLVSQYRRIAGRWTGTVIAEPYRPYPEPPLPAEDGRYQVGRVLYTDRAAAIRAQRYGWVHTDPATWRDQLWMATNPLLGLLGLIPAALFSVGLFGLALQPLTWVSWGLPVGVFAGEWISPWYLWYGFTQLGPGPDWIPDWASSLIGLAMAGVGALLGPPLLRLRLRYDQLLLRPTNSAALSQRVRELTQTRADAVDAQATELRRIERDLHDGAQARLIAVGLSLANIERLMDTDPAAARTLVAQARETSATALTELRDLVHGIHPPVLAERGLPDAVRSVALDNPVPVRVDIGLAGRFEAPIESAAYFATLEALANATRHSDANLIVIDIAHTGDTLRIIVTDNGQGGADPRQGSGLRGVQRRISAFDGVLAVNSPPGGPTVVTLHIPCPAPA